MDNPKPGLTTSSTSPTQEPTAALGSSRLRRFTSPPPGLLKDFHLFLFPIMKTQRRSLGAAQSDLNGVRVQATLSFGERLGEGERSAPYPTMCDRVENFLLRSHVRGLRFHLRLSCLHAVPRSAFTTVRVSPGFAALPVLRQQYGSLMVGQRSLSVLFPDGSTVTPYNRISVSGRTGYKPLTLPPVHTVRVLGVSLHLSLGQCLLAPLQAHHGAVTICLTDAFAPGLSIPLLLVPPSGLGIWLYGRYEIASVM